MIPTKFDSRIIGGIAIQRDGYVGYVMDVKPHAVIVDGEEVAHEDIRMVRVGDGEIAIMNYAATLGHDVESQKAIAEAVRLLRLKTGDAPEVVSDDKSLQEAVAEVVDKIEELDVRTMSYVNRRVRMAEGKTGLVKGEEGDELTVLPDDSNELIKVKKQALFSVIRDDENPQSANLLAIIESLRSEIKILERENKMLTSTGEAKDQTISRLETDLELEQKARRLAESVALEARLSSIPETVPVQSGSTKPYGAKIVMDTTEERCELLWEDNWELMHSQFSPDGKLQTLWRKVNDYQRPDGSPIREAVALPQLSSIPMEDTSPILSIQEVDAVLYGSENALPESPVLEIVAADVFERFDGDITGALPIAQALKTHGFDAVNQALELMDNLAAAQAIESSKGTQLANRPISQFGTVEPVGSI